LETEDVIARELVLKLYVNGEFFDTLYCSGQDVKALVIGHLFVHKVIFEMNQITNIWQNGDVIEVDAKSEERNLSQLNKIKPFEFSANTSLKLMQEFQEKSFAFQKTGAIHAAALSDGSKIYLFSEDISRNNALEILLGNILIEDFPVHDKMVLLTCRVTKQIAQSLAMINVPWIVTKAAVSNAAIDICKQNNIGLIGFARQDSMNYYHYPLGNGKLNPESL
jgi:FdhD protein